MADTSEGDCNRSDIELESLSEDSDHDFRYELTDDDIDSNVAPGNIQPYQFEPAAEKETEDELSSDVNSVDERRLISTEWCQCGNCIIMPTALKSTCCKDIPQVAQVARKLEEFDDSLTFICDHPGFSSVCLDPYVLETAYYQYRQQYGERQTTIQQRNRYTAYRQLSRWCWGYLERSVRVPLPSCAVSCIHLNFPSANYKGYKES